MSEVVNQGGENALVQWDPNSGAALPAYLTDAMGGLGSNIPDRQTVPSLSYEGKVWAIHKDGNKTKLQSQNSDGDMVPVPVMRAVILKFNADRGRAYYPATYNPSATAQPDCWSPDGKAPDASAKNKQASLCANCPQSVKGSKVQDGKEMVACGSHRMIAVLPAFDLVSDPLRLKIAVTSDYDKEIVEHGWFAFRQYSDWLKSRGITHTGLVVTKIKFDMQVAYPKLLFALDRVLTQNEVAQVMDALKNPKVDELLAERWSAAGTNGTNNDDRDIKPWGLEGAYADGWTAHPDAAGYSYKGQDVVDNVTLAARYPEPTPPPAPAPEVPAAQQVVDQTPAAPPAPAAAAAPPPATPHDPIANAEANGWIKHPSAPEYHYKGDEVVLTTELAARYPAPQAAAPAAPAVPAAPAAPVVPEKSPMEKATADGWILHPSAPDYHYKGDEVVLTTELLTRYAGNAPANAGTTAGAAAGQTATSGASPSSGEVPADVQDLLNKWAGA